MLNHTDALRLLKELKLDHSYLQQALAALGMEYIKSEIVIEKEKTPVKTNQTKPIDDECQPDFDFQITCVTQKQQKDNTEKHPILDKIQTFDVMSFSSTKPVETQSLIPLWQENLLHQALLPFFFRQKISQKPDIVKVTQQFSRKQPIQTIPRLKINHFPSEVWLYCDYADGANIYHADYKQVEIFIKKWFGNNVLTQKLQLIQRGGLYQWRMSNAGSQFNALNPPENAIALILVSNNSLNKPIWKNFVQALSQIKTTVVYLTLESNIPKPTLSIAKISALKSVSATKQQKFNKLMTALSLSPEVLTLPMMRELRIELVKGEPELEALVAEHHNIEWYQSNNTGFWRHDATTEQSLIRELLTPEEQLLAHHIIEKHLTADDECWQRKHQLLTLLFCTGLPQPKQIQLSKDISNYYGKFAAHIHKQPQGSEVEWLMIQARSLGEQLEKLPLTARRAFTLSNVLWRQQSGSNEQLPGIDPALWKELYQQQHETELPAKIVQQGDKLQLCQTDMPSGVLISTLKDLASLIIEPQTARQSDSLLLTTNEQLIVSNVQETLTLKTISSNDFYWAKTLSITSQGVIAETDYIKVSWPSIPTSHDESNRGDYNGVIIQVKPHAPEWLHKNQPQLDKHGLFIELEVKRIKLKLRYIPPGSFLMGSPETEAQREDDETQHPVTLTQGFWLGETTVSQVLWQAMMANNPSNFKAEKDELLPVDSVSWDDCQKFCQRINEKIPGLELSLPTEAQWEYACRAGTETPFSTGEQLSTEQVNYDGNYPYNDGEKGQYRQKTVAVSSFSPNGWGLYQMHGNLWEWCSDGMRDYQPQAEVNPVGTSEGSLRVLRGGSWGDFGRNCRSAAPARLQRVSAFRDIGLRVSQVEPARERAVPADPIRSGARAGKGKASGSKPEGILSKVLKKK